MPSSAGPRRGRRTGPTSGAAARRRRAPRTCTRPHRRRRARSRPRSRTNPALERLRPPIPEVPVADDGDAARIRRPDRERDPLVGDVGTEALVDPLVASLAGEMEIELPSFTGAPACGGSPRPGSRPSRAGCSAHSGARRRPSRARRSSAVARPGRGSTAAARIRRLEVAVEERAAAAILPALGRVDVAPDLRRRRGIRERAQHSRDVPEW